MANNPANNPQDVMIVGYARTPFHFANKGALAKVRPDDMAATAIRGLLGKCPNLPLEEIEDVIMGCAFGEGEQSFNIGKIAAQIVGLPISVAGLTVNRFCGSAMQSVHIAAGAISMGAGCAFICGGVESMTRVPMGGFNPMPNPKLMKTYPQAYMNMGLTAENIAKASGITRLEQEQFALSSHQKATAAQKAGHFADEIVAVNTKDGEVTQDGCPRADSSLDAMATLKPAFDAAGVVTAATSSPLTDGAVALLITSRAFAEKHKLTPMAVVRSVAVAGCAAETMGMGPVPATQKALARAGLTITDIDVAELNEAFAVQALAVVKALGLPLEKVNLDGGAIALGHPLGASGGRILGKAASLLQRTGGRYALATMCIGGGQGIATIIERV